jgi:hypothetical protein
MKHDAGAHEGRAVLIQTTDGAMEGWLAINPSTRTTDHLNLACPRFVVVDVAGRGVPGWSVGRGTTGISVAAVLFVAERQDVAPRTDSRIERSHFSRAAVRLQLGRLEVQGFLHVPRLSDPLTRLTHQRQQFLPLTAVSVVGPDVELAAPYLAVNHDHILAFQSLRDADDAPVGLEACRVAG